MKIEFQYPSFTKEVQDSAQRPAKLRRLVWASVRAVSFRAERYIKLRMPVDTGRARASWGHSSAPAGAEEGIWEEDQQDLTLVQGSRVDYTEDLNNGSSQQAPAGFIDVEVQRAVNDMVKLIESDIEKGA